MASESEKFKGTHVKVKLSVLIQHALAAIIYGSRGIQSLADSITSFGGLIHNPKVTTPDADGNYRVLSGWRRVLAAILLGWDSMYVEVMENLPPEDEALCIVECNNHRVKTSREKHEEIKVYEIELPKRRGERNDLVDGEKYDQRKAIAAKMDISDAEVRDLKIVGAAPNGPDLLDSIDGKTVTLTALARKVKQIPEVMDYSSYIAVEPVTLDEAACPVCNCHPTKRIEIIDRKLYYVN